MDLTGKTVLVVGSGISGVAATELLKKKNVNVVLFDGNKELDLTALREKHPVFADVKIILGELTAEDRSGLDLVVLSPGVPTDLPMVEDLKKDGIPIWGEIELACHFAKGRIVAITGTNGKTTTTALYRNSIYLRGCGHHGRDSDGGGDQQLSAGDHSHISPGSFRYFKYHAGSSEPSSHDGVLY